MQFLKNNRMILASTLLLLGSVFLISGVSPAHAQTGTVCIIPNDATSCPSSPAPITGTVGTQLKVSVFIQGSDHINGFDITLLGNHTILMPAGFDLNGTILPAPQTVLQECLSGIEKINSGPACSQTDTVDTLRVSAIGASGMLSSATTGLLFHAVYNVTGATTGTSLSFQTGCGSPTNPTSDPPLCVTIANGTLTPVTETVQTATFSTGLSSPTITTNLPQTTVPIGASMYDNATLQGATTTAGGSVNYNLYGDGTCSGVSSAISTVTVKDAVVPGSSNFQLSAAGAYSFQAVYSGDVNNSGAISACEPFTTCVCAPAIVVILSSTSVGVGGTVTASADLVSTFQATGTVTYLLYDNGLCVPPGNTVSTVGVVKNTVPNSRPVTFNSTGSFSWNAFYSGDFNNNGATSSCAPMTVVAPDFALSPNPSSLQIITGSIGTSTITITSLDGFNGTVSLSTSPPPLCPACSTWSISPSSVALSANGSANATLTIMAGSAPFSANVTVFGMSGSLSHSAIVRLTVVTPDFTITASPLSMSVPRGSTASFTITVKGVNGFNNTVTLTATISPVVKRGPTLSLPSTVGPYSTSTLTVSTMKNTPSGSYTVTVTATSGSLTHSVTVTVIVTR